MDVPLPFLVAIVLTGGVWAVVLALRLSTLHACLGLLLTVACFGVSFANWEIGSLTFSADRLLLILLVGLAGLKRLLTAQPRLQFDLCDLVLAALMVLLVVSVRMHPAPPRSSETSPTPTYLFLASYLSPALLFWIMRYRVPLVRDLRFVLGFFVVFGLYLALTAIFETHGPSAWVFPKHILKARELYAGRAVGPFLSAPALGTWITVATVSVVLAWRSAVGPWKWLLLPMLPVLAYAEYLTQTRSAWMGFAIAVPLALVLSVRHEVRHFVIVALVGAGLLVGLIKREEFLLPERVEGRGVVAQSAAQRLALLQKSLALFVERPLLGWGFGQFEHVSKIHGGGGPLQLVPSSAAEGLASHNVLLRFLAETGLVGTALLVVLFGTWLARTWHTLKSRELEPNHRLLAILFLGTFIAYVAEAMFHDVTFISQDHILLFFLAGALYAAPDTTDTNPKRQRGLKAIGPIERRVGMV